MSESGRGVHDIAQLETYAIFNVFFFFVAADVDSFLTSPVEAAECSYSLPTSNGMRPPGTETVCLLASGARGVVSRSPANATLPGVDSRTEAVGVFFFLLDCFEEDDEPAVGTGESFVAAVL